MANPYGSVFAAVLIVSLCASAVFIECSSAGLPHTVNGYAFDNPDGTSAVGATVKIYVSSRPAQTLTGTVSPDHAWTLNTGNFDTDWSDGDTLVIELYNEYGDINSTTLVLDRSGSQQAQNLTIPASRIISRVIVNDSAPNKGDVVKILARLINTTSASGHADQNISFYAGDAYAGLDETNATGWAEVDWTVPHNATFGVKTVNATHVNVYNNTTSLTVCHQSKITWGSPNSGNYSSGSITLSCEVTSVNLTPLDSYPVRFHYQNDGATQYIGEVNTDFNGGASVSWDISGLAEGTYHPKCNITDNVTSYYTISPDYEDNTSILIDRTSPVISGTSANETVVRTGSAVMITSNVSDVHSSVESVYAYIQKPDEANIAIARLYDDGTNGDAIGGDGTYTLQGAVDGFAEGTYYIDMVASDFAENSAESENALTIIKDDTPPAAANKNPANGSYVSETKPTISVDILDTASGVNPNTIDMKIGGASVSKSITAISNGYHVSHTPVSELAHGESVSVNVSSGDNAANNASYNWSFKIDALPPTISITSPDDGYSTSSQTITISGDVNGTDSVPTVAINGVNISLESEGNESSTYSVVVYLSTGLNSITAAATDEAGNTATASISVTRSFSSVGGGVSGSETTSSGEISVVLAESVNHISKISTDEVSVLKFDDVEIHEVEIQVSKDVESISIGIRKLSGKPPDVVKPAVGASYTYIDISAENITDEDVESAVITFSVPVAWIDENGIDEDRVSLQRYNETTQKWAKLSTQKLGRSKTLINYSAVSPGFSVFAIVGERETSGTAATQMPTAAIQPSAAPTAVPSLTATVSAEPTSTSQPDSLSVERAAVIGVLISILIICLLLYRDRDKIRSFLKRS